MKSSFSNGEQKLYSIKVEDHTQTLQPCADKYKNNNKIDSPNFSISFAVPAACLLPFFRDNFQLQLRVSQIKSQNVTTTLKMLVTLTKSKEHVGTICNNCANKQDRYISEKSIGL